MEPILESSYKKLLSFKDSYLLSQFDILEAIGEDRESFLQGQTTYNVKTIKSGRGNLAAILDLSGKVQFFFYLLNAGDKYFILVDKNYSSNLIEHFEKFIIMDDVIIKRQVSKKAILNLLEYEPSAKEEKFFTSIYGIEGIVSFTEKVEHYCDAKELISIVDKFNVHPFQEWFPVYQRIINETILYNEAVDLKKGCFLGQEVVSKIENGRKAAYFPMILAVSENIDFSDESTIKKDGRKIGVILKAIKIRDENYFIAELLRDFRIEGLSLSFELGKIVLNSTVKSLNCLIEENKKISNDLFVEASKCYSKNEWELAESYFKASLILNCNNENSYEGLCMLYGGQDKFDKAIALMDRLLIANPDSIMAHTNKSMFLMRTGKIQEAEEEKALAMMASMKNAGKEISEEVPAVDFFELERKEKMFREVLEIDNDDVMANNGLAEIFSVKGMLKQAEELYLKVIEIDKKYTQSYLGLGKILIKMGDNERAKLILEKGSRIAASKGELMPANEMQALLSSLSRDDTDSSSFEV